MLHTRHRSTFIRTWQYGVAGMFLRPGPSPWNRVCSVLRSIMIRKLLTAAIVFLIAGLTPAGAIIGFCTRMPCCNHASAVPLAFASEANDCCTMITCYESPSAKLTNGTATSCTLLTTPALVPAALLVRSSQLIARELVDISPPIETRHRLATLSTLLI